MSENHKNSIWIIPWGSIEYYGPHLPLLTDSIIAYHVSKEIAKEINGKVFEPISKGICFHMGVFPETISYPKNQILKIFKEVFERADRSNIQRIYLVIGHGENLNLISDILNNHSHKSSLEIKPFYIYDNIILDIICKHTTSKLIFNIVHGGEIETSLILEIQEKLVHINKDMIRIYPNITEELLIERYDEIPLGSFTSIGYFGDPNVASKSKGRKFLKIILDCFYKSFNSNYK